MMTTMIKWNAAMLPRCRVPEVGDPPADVLVPPPEVSRRTTAADWVRSVARCLGADRY